MDFLEIANARQSCRSYDEARPVENEKLEKILEAAQLAPSACNGQLVEHHWWLSNRIFDLLLFDYSRGTYD